jgi:hypothetical protein
MRRARPFNAATITFALCVIVVASPSWSQRSATSYDGATATRRPLASVHVTLVLAPMRVATTQPAPLDASEEPEGDNATWIIEMFAAPEVTPFAPPFSLRPFGPPPRPLRLIYDYDGAEDATPRASVSVGPALAILRDYDDETPASCEVRVVVEAPSREASSSLPALRVAPLADGSTPARPTTAQTNMNTRNRTSAQRSRR